MYGQDNAMKTVTEVMARVEKEALVCADSLSPAFSMGVEPIRQGYLDFKKRGVKIRFVTEITQNNIRYVKQLTQFAQVRHMDNVKGNMAVSEHDYVATATLEGARPITQTIHSNAKAIIEQNKYFFDNIWDKAIPAEQRIKEIELGVEPERTEVIYGGERVLETLDAFLAKADFEVRIMAPRPEMVAKLDQMHVFRRLMSLKYEKNLLIRLAAAFGESNSGIFSRIAPYVQYKSIEPLAMSSLILVRDKMEVIIFSFSGHVDEENGSINILLKSTDKTVVETMLSTFEAWWNQFEINERMKEEKSHAELLLDLITHDIGNHNQIVTPNLELAQMTLDKYRANKDQVSTVDVSAEDLRDVYQFVASAQNAHQRSVTLVENIRRLEKMYRDREVKLTQQDLLLAIDSAIATVRHSNKTNKEIQFTVDLGEKEERPVVLADSLLEEIFSNLFSNAAKAAEGRQVEINVKIQEIVIGHLRYWMVHVTDNGKGIPDEAKPQLFSRFYAKAAGTGLGLSIVRALVERYGGKVWVGNRVSADYTKGASFGFILQDAKSPEK